MRKRHPNCAGVLLVAVFLSAAPAVVWGQDPDQQPTAPVPAFGQDNPPAPVTENPPISAIDQPGLEPHAAPLSYLQLGAHFTESADSNVAGLLGAGNGVRSVTRALGSLELQRLWSNYDLALDYIGGAGYYNARGIGFKQLQQLSVDQRINWKRGQLSVRDAFSYLPEGNFAGGYGTLSATGQALAGFGSSGGFPTGSLGGLGQVPRIMNISLAELTESLTPKSSLTASAEYAFVHYTGDNPGVQGIPFLGSKEVSAQAGYDRIVGPHDQLALTYAYQGFNFSPSAAALFETSFHTHVIQAMWGHRISGRMDLKVGAGPQITVLTQSIPNVASVSDLRLTVAGQASLRYRFPKTSVEAAYQRFTTSGSGLFPGANSDIGHLSASRPLTRVWNVFADAGYARNARVLAEGGVGARTYSYGFAGMGVHRQLGREFRVYGSYQFNYLMLDRSFCGAGAASCNRIARRQIVLLGLDWTPRPIRLD